MAHGCVRRSDRPSHDVPHQPADTCACTHAGAKTINSATTAIGETMLVTSVAQLLTAPLAIALERRIDGRLLTAFGFGLFAVGLWLSAGQDGGTDYDELVWPQIVRGAAIMLCLLHPTRLALGHMALE
jgi:hypothetical protein